MPAFTTSHHFFFFLPLFPHLLQPFTFNPAHGLCTTLILLLDILSFTTLPPQSRSTISNERCLHHSSLPHDCIPEHFKSQTQLYTHVTISSQEQQHNNYSEPKQASPSSRVMKHNVLDNLKQEQPHPKPRGFLADLLGEIKMQTAVPTASSKKHNPQHSSHSSTLKWSSGLSAGCAGATASSRALQESTISYRSQLRPAGPSLDDCRGTSHYNGLRCPLDSPSRESSLDYSPLLDSRPADYRHISTLPCNISRTSRVPQPVGDFYRASRIPRMPRDHGRHGNINNGRGSRPYRPGKTATTQRPIPTCGGTQGTLPPLQNINFDSAPLTVDQIVTNLQRFRPKLQAQMGAAKKEPESHRRTTDTYPSLKSKQQEPRHLGDPQEYAAWGQEQLLREVNIRHLSYEHEDVAYLIEIIIVNDRVFLKRLEIFKHLSIKQLLDEVRYKNISIDFSKHWEHRPLLTLIAEILAQVSVSGHSDLLRAEDLPAQKAQARAPATTMQGRPLRGAHLSKAHMINLQIEASKNGTGSEDKPKPRPNRNEKNKDGSGSQGSDSGYSTTKIKFSTSPPTSKGDDENDKSSLDRSTEPLIRRNSRQNSADLPSPSVHAGSKPRNPSNKHARSTENKDDIEERPAKRTRTSFRNNVAIRRNPYQARQVSDIASDHAGETKFAFESSSPQSKPDKVDKIKVAKQTSTKRKERVNQETAIPGVETADVSMLNKYTPASAAKKSIARKNARKELTDASLPPDDPSISTPNKSPKRKTLHDEDDEDSGQVPTRKDKKSEKRKPTTISAEERILDQIYTKNTDGSWKRKERAKKSAAATKAKPNFNFIKP